MSEYFGFRSISCTVVLLSMASCWPGPPVAADYLQTTDTGTTQTSIAEADTTSDGCGLDAEDECMDTGPSRDSSTTSGSSDSETTGSDSPDGPPSTPSLALDFSPIKQFDFSWLPVAEADHYRLMERLGPSASFDQLGGNIPASQSSISHAMPLHLRTEASYRLDACNADGCTPSAIEDIVPSSLTPAIGYIKASNTGEGDWFGNSVALSGDGRTLAVGAPEESSDSTMIDGDGSNNNALCAGAVYVFVRDESEPFGWAQQAYIKASNAGVGDQFGFAVALNEDGNTLAIGARFEGGNNAECAGNGSGATYLFTRDMMNQWAEYENIIRASNPDPQDQFGWSISLSSDGSTLAVGALMEASNATEINNEEQDNTATEAGAVYVFTEEGSWAQQAYIKSFSAGTAPANRRFFGQSVALDADGNTLAVGELGGRSIGPGYVTVLSRDGFGGWSLQEHITGTDHADNFGNHVAVSHDGETLAVGAWLEDGNATLINGDQGDNSAVYSGAAYVYEYDEIGGWEQQAYVKASNPMENAFFGISVALSASGDTLAVGAHGEDGDGIGVGADSKGAPVYDSGATYVYERNGMGGWNQRTTYTKASNTGGEDRFGIGISLSDDGNTLAVGAVREGSSSTGVSRGDAMNDIWPWSGAVYLY